MRRCFGVFTACVLAVAGMATAASAADLPVPGGATYTPPVSYQPAMYNWSSVYLGGNFGMGVLLDTVTPTGAALTNAGIATKISTFDILGGGQAGFNIQFSQFVLGAEGTFSGSNLTGEEVNGTENSRDSVIWYATAVGRGGLALNDVLLYAKGGGAWMHVAYNQSVAGATETDYGNRTGYAVGGGIEYGLLENLSARFDYTYMAFGTASYPFASIPQPVSVTSNIHALTLGLNYRFVFGGR